MNTSKILKGIAAVLGFPIVAYKNFQRLGHIQRQLDDLAAQQHRLLRYGFRNGERLVYFHNRHQGNRLIHQLLETDEPVMIARHGRVELIAAAGYEIYDTIPNLEQLHLNAGFFPCDHDHAKRWAALYLECLRELDCLVEWNFRDKLFVEAENIFGKYHPQSKLINHLHVLTPFLFSQPWTKALEGKRVLIIHPFEQSIRNQYAIRERLFENPDVVPEFGELLTLKAIQTIAGTTDPRFESWFDAYKFMCDESDKLDFDVAMIGAGSYGLPLAAHIKRSGRSAVNVGGGLQLLFGIRGARWESKGDPLGAFVNEHWVRPLQSERPRDASRIENGCYW